MFVKILKNFNDKINKMFVNKETLAAVIVNYKKLVKIRGY